MKRTICPHGISPKRNCKICNNLVHAKYQKTDKGRMVQKRYRESLKGKECQLRWYKSPGFYKTQIKYLKKKQKEFSKESFGRRLLKWLSSKLHFA